MHCPLQQQQVQITTLLQARVLSLPAHTPFAASLPLLVHLVARLVPYQRSVAGFGVTAACLVTIHPLHLWPSRPNGAPCVV